MEIKGIIPKVVAYSLICILILLTPGLVYGQETLRAATLSDFTGEVSIMKAGGERPIKAFKQMSLTQGDRIITGRNASATLVIDKDIVLYVTENTQMLISELIESAKADSETTSLNLQTGGIWTGIKKALNVNSKFEIKTPTAVMGARGTEFYTSHIGNTTDVSVLSGAVSISSYTSVVNEDGTAEQITLEVILKNNQHMTLETKPDELIDFIAEELTLEKMDLFAAEMIKNILETEPELVKPELIEKIDQIIEQKKEEKNQQREKEQEENPERRIEYDSALQEDNSGSGGEDGDPSPTLTVSFDVDGGSTVDSQIVDYNGKVSQPAEPSKTGYTFGGWYTDNTFVTAFDFSNTRIIANTTIYAKWTANPTYTVTYNGNGNTGGSVSTDSNNYEAGDMVMVLGNTGNLVKAGYTFAGWNTASDGSGTSYVGGNTFFMGMANVILYAQWTINPTYTVTYSGNGNTGGTTPTDSNNYTQGATVTVLGNTGNFVKTGYAFEGWDTQADGNGTNYAAGATFTMGAANVTLYAQWTANPIVSVTISPETGTFDKNPANQADVSTTITWNDAASVTDVKKDGISVGAAFYAVNGNTLTIKKEYLATQPAGSLVLAVEFDNGNTATLTISISDTTAPTYSIASISNQTMTALTTGYASGTQETRSITVTRTGTGVLTNFAAALSGANAGDFIITQLAATALDAGTPSTTFTVKAKDGLTAGTYTATVTVSADNMTPVTFTATQAVSAAPTYTVTFDSQSGSSVSSINNASSGSTISEPTAPTWAGYTFGGWYKESACINAWNFSTDTVTGNITLYAKWAINQYTVSFEVDGGSAVDSQTVNYNGTATEPEAPTKTGYTFGGWYIDSELTTVFNFTTAITEDTTLYAKWGINSYSVTFNSNGESEVNSQTVGYNDTVAEPAVPTKTGYTFAGWYSDAELTMPFNFTNAITGDITLYAKWIQGVLCRIYTADDLYSVCDAVYQEGDYYFRLETDIDLSDTVWGEVYALEHFTGGWLPIGTDEGPFTGYFDGNGKIISGLYIDRPDEDGVGLFGYSENAIFEDVRLDGVNVTGNIAVGGLVGNAYESEIRNCNVTGSVTGTGGVGGLAGYAVDSNITNSYAATGSGSISGDGSIGGLVGVNDGGVISDSYAVGNVEGLREVVEIGFTGDVGGLVGENRGGTIMNSYATGIVTSISIRVGGLVGSNYGEITDSHALGDVSSAGYTGGLVGVNDGGTISGSYAAGDVEGVGEGEGYYVGGLVGMNRDGGAIEKSYAAGGVTGKHSVGGLVGYSNGIISQSYAAGPVEGIDDWEIALQYNGVGGLVGTHNGEITDAYATGGVTGFDNVGGLIGLNQSDGIVKNTYAAGFMTGDVDAVSVGGLVGLAGDYGDGYISDSYYDSDTTGRSGEDNEWGTPKFTIDMKKQATFNPEPGVGWDFGSIWMIEEDNTYPQFRW